MTNLFPLCCFPSPGRGPADVDSRLGAGGALDKQAGLCLFVSFPSTTTAWALTSLCFFCGVSKVIVSHHQPQCVISCVYNQFWVIFLLFVPCPQAPAPAVDMPAVAAQLTAERQELQQRQAAIETAFATPKPVCQQMDGCIFDTSVRQPGSHPESEPDAWQPQLGDLFLVDQIMHRTL